MDSRRRAQRTFSGGVWHLGVAPRRVRIILLDNRHSRDPYGGDGGRAQDMLGEEQWAWLEAELRGGEAAEVTVIGSGIQVGPWQRVAQRKRDFPPLPSTPPPPRIPG